MSFETQGSAQGYLVASTWATLKPEIATPTSPGDQLAAVNAMCAVLNGMAYLWDQHYGTTIQYDSGGTDKPKTIAT